MLHDAQRERAKSRTSGHPHAILKWFILLWENPNNCFIEMSIINYTEMIVSGRIVSLFPLQQNHHHCHASSTTHRANDYGQTVANCRCAAARSRVWIPPGRLEPFCTVALFLPRFNLQKHAVYVSLVNLHSLTKCVNWCRLSKFWIWIWIHSVSMISSTFPLICCGPVKGRIIHAHSWCHRGSIFRFCYWSNVSAPNQVMTSAEEEMCFGAHCLSAGCD